MKRFLIIFILIFLFVSVSLSQFTERVYYLRSVTVDVGGNYQSYKVGSTTLSETSIPVQVTLPFSDNLSMSITNIPVMVSRTAPDTLLVKSGTNYINQVADKKTSVSTITDTRIGLKYLFLNSRALLTLNANIPSGKKELDEDAFNVETQLGIGILKYRMPIFGQGFNFGGSFVYAVPLNKKNIFGVGLSYNLKSKYIPVKSIDYDPGDDYGISLSYIFLPSTDMKLSLDASFANFSKDVISFNPLNSTDDEKINLEFQSGSKFTVIAQANIMTGSIQHWVTVQSKIRGKNQRQIATPTVVNNIIQWNYEFKDLDNKPTFEGSYNIYFPITPYMTVSGNLTGRMYGAGQDNWNGVVIQSDNSTVFGGGLGLRLMLLDNLGLDLNAKYFVGTLKLENEYDVSGMDVFAKFNILF